MADRQRSGDELRPCAFVEVWHREAVIASVAFHNFKALRSTSLRLGPCNLLIGPNGSGKTSLIQAVLQLRSLAKLSPGTMEETAKPTGGPAVPNPGAGKAEIIFQFSAPHDKIEARLSCVAEVVCDHLELTPSTPAAWQEVKSELARVRSFFLDHSAIMQPSLPAAGAELAANGANLAAVLADRRTQSPAMFEKLEQEVTRLFPEFSQVVLAPIAGGKIELGLKLAEHDRIVTADNLSQGTLGLLALLTLAFDPAPPSIVCIEEIDRGIHPRMLREVRDALYRLCYPASFGESRAPVQVIATTHSPYLLDLFRDHPEEIVITQKHGAEARFERLSDRADLNDLLREGSLGDMWFSGILGGVPDGE